LWLGPCFVMLWRLRGRGWEEDEGLGIRDGEMR
jgi:hypothetical protein